MKYKLLSDPSPKKLEENVNIFIAEGYELVGQPFMGPYDYLYQAMTLLDRHSWDLTTIYPRM